MTMYTLQNACATPRCMVPSRAYLRVIRYARFTMPGSYMMITAFPMPVLPVAYIWETWSGAVLPADRSVGVESIQVSMQVARVLPI
jgi:hypothetical protein